MYMYVHVGQAFIYMYETNVCTGGNIKMAEQKNSQISGGINGEKSIWWTRQAAILGQPNMYMYMYTTVYIINYVMTNSPKVVRLWLGGQMSPTPPIPP